MYLLCLRQITGVNVKMISGTKRGTGLVNPEQRNASFGDWCRGKQMLVLELSLSLCDNRQLGEGTNVGSLQFNQTEET